MKQTIRERLDAQKAFRQRMKEKYPEGPPRVRVGIQINTIFGPGIVIDSEVHFKTQYPLVEYDSFPIHTSGSEFRRKALLLYPYEFDCQPLEVCDVATHQN